MNNNTKKQHNHQPSRQSINLSGFRVKSPTTNGLTYSSHQHVQTYQPKFIFQFLNSQQNSQTDIPSLTTIEPNQNTINNKQNTNLTYSIANKKKDMGNRNTLKQIDSHNVNENLILIGEEKRVQNQLCAKQLQRVKRESFFEREKNKQAMNCILQQNENLKKQRQKLQENLYKKQKQYEDIKNNINQIEQEFFKTKQEVLQLSKQNQQLTKQIAQLRKKLNISEGQNKNYRQIIKQNKTLIISNKQPIDYIQIYQDLEAYLKQRSQLFIHQLKAFRMHKGLEISIENFLQQILHINAITIKNHKKKKQQSQFSNNNSFSLSQNNNLPQQEQSLQNQQYSMVSQTKQRLLLDKSIQKLKSIQKSTDKQLGAFASNSMNNLTRTINNTNTNITIISNPTDRSGLLNSNILNVSNNGLRQRDRSKSRRKIFE